MSVILSALAAITAAQGVVSTASPCPSPTFCNPDVLQPVMERLRAARSGQGAPVHILQIGDSHTAGDMITGALRSRLQARYGSGGRGVLAAGRPYSGYLTWGVTASQSSGWSVNALFGGRYSAGGPPIGLSGFTQTAQSAGERLAVTTDTPDQDFDRIVVCALVRPGGGSVSLRMGAAEQSWSLNAPGRGAACRTLETDRPVSSASITTLDSGPVSITSFATFRRAGGVVVSNVGVVGAQLQHLGRAEDAVVREELRALQPDLIVLAYGTNEGFGARGPDSYEAALRAQVARVRRAAGRDVPIMLLAAPDAATRNAALGGPACGNGWRIPAYLGEVRSIQRRVARELRLGFWDWEQAMGGTCASSRWTAAGLMRGDGVHFTRQGGDRIGAAIFDDLEALSTLTAARRPGAAPDAAIAAPVPASPDSRRPLFQHPVTAPQQDVPAAPRRRP